MKSHGISVDMKGNYFLGLHTCTSALGSLAYLSLGLLFPIRFPSMSIEIPNIAMAICASFRSYSLLYHHYFCCSFEGTAAHHCEFTAQRC
ncbi:hypothetical protein GE21DRAFT_1116247 [Neurospora crassa]|nr:hypothetical protein GE21DRAFT_1116247 [Neurospora crassa]